MARRRDDATAKVARVFAQRRPHDAAATIAWLHPDHGRTVAALFDGTARTVDLPAAVASAAAAALPAEMCEHAGRGETRQSVLAALGRPAPKHRPASPVASIPLEDPDRLRAWVERRRRLDADCALAVCTAAPELAPMVVERSQLGARAALYLAAAHRRIEVHPSDLAGGVEAIGHLAGLRREALHTVWRRHSDELWSSTGEDPAWWRLAAATCSLRADWAATDVPVALHGEFSERAASLQPAARAVAAKWLARSGACFAAVGPLVDGPADASLVALDATDPDCGAALAALAADDPGRMHAPERLLARFAGAVPPERAATIALVAVRHARSAGFVWDLAAGRGKAPVGRRHMAAVCDALAQHCPGEFADAVCAPTIPFDRPRRTWTGPIDRSHDALVELWVRRAADRGWRELLELAYQWPSATVALAELVADAVDRTGTQVEVGVLFELLEGWPGTLDELAAVAASSS